MNSKENNLPLVSIGIPTYNNAVYIADAVKSAMAQDYPNLEIIIIDDASTDNTADIVAMFNTDPRVKYTRNDHNIGRVANYRKGLYDLAGGAWYLNLDGDDYLTDHSFISKAISWIQKYENIVMVAGACDRLVDGKLHYTIQSKYNTELSSIPGTIYFLDLVAEKSYFIHLATLYNRVKAIALNFYSEDILSTDYESLYRLALTGNIISYEKVVGVWRIHGGNASSQNIFSVDDIIRNFKFVENAASFSLSYLPKEKVQRWRKEYLIKITESYILQVVMCRPKNSFVIVSRLFKRYPWFFIRACINILSRNAKKLFRSRDSSVKQP